MSEEIEVVPEGTTQEEKDFITRISQTGLTVSVRADRKINLGNYESFGFGFTINYPLALTEEEDAMFKKLINEAIAKAAKELNENIDSRVTSIKKSLGK